MDELIKKAQEQINGMSEQEKQRLLSLVEEDCKIATHRYYATLLHYTKALSQNEDCEWFGEGEYCVYMWLHADGTPFYVGSGKGNRWKSTNRNDRFFEETAKLDTFVVKIVDGLTQEESREAEFCLSHYLSYNGYRLANWDNNYTRCVDEKQADRRVGKYVRLINKPHNKLTIEQAKKKMRPYETTLDLSMIHECYVQKYGYPV